LGADDAPLAAVCLSCGRALAPAVAPLPLPLRAATLPLLVPLSTGLAGDGLAVDRLRCRTTAAVLLRVTGFLHGLLGLPRPIEVLAAVQRARDERLLANPPQGRDQEVDADRRGLTKAKNTYSSGPSRIIICCCGLTSGWGLRPMIWRCWYQLRKAIIATSRM
jgi:hypothetical protein